MTRIKLARSQVLTWNDRWDNGDRNQIAAFLDGIGDSLAYKDEVEHLRIDIDIAVSAVPTLLAYMYRTPSGGSVKGMDSQDQLLFEIRPGAIDLLMGIDLTILHFSTVGWWGPRQRAAEVEVITCRVHHMELPQSGVCDSCG